jgi:putative FmdB family regulatory protein
MPIYEYRCNACNIQFDLRQKFSDPPADRCPKCGGTVRKLVSAVSFSLKGAGWFGDCAIHFIWTANPVLTGH